MKTFLKLQLFIHVYVLYTCVCAYDHTRKTALVTPLLCNFRMELRNPWHVLQDLPHLVLSCSSNNAFSP